MSSARRRVQKLTFSTRHADAVGFDLEAQATLVLPQSGRDPGLHAWGCYLSGSIKVLARILLSTSRTGRDAVGES